MKSPADAWLTEDISPTSSLPISASAESPMAQSNSTSALPALVAKAGPAASFAWEEFIYAKIRNPHTRAAYERAIRQFLEHCDQLGKDLPHISPRDVGAYLDGLDYAPATKKLHLSALRHFFDTLVIRHVVVLNPAASVRGERLQVVEGKTPEISIEQARRLMRSIDISTVVGLRDRAIITILIYTAARVGSPSCVAGIFTTLETSTACGSQRKGASRERFRFDTIYRGSSRNIL